MHNFNLDVGQISKIEGKAGLSVKVEDGKIKDLKFIISEYKRFYTQAIKGKDIVSLPQISSRICGTCSNAHLICAIKAVENAVKLEVSDQTKILRKLVNFGLNIRDHGLHLYVFVLPDIFGIDNILELDENDQYQHQLLHDIFSIKDAGNSLGKLIGGRSVHAPFLTVGGFSKLPDEKEFPALCKKLEDVRPAVIRLIKIFTDCDFKLERPSSFAALMDEDYSLLEGEILTDTGVKANEDKFGDFLKKEVITYSQATGYKFLGKVYTVGALARLNLGKDRLHKNTLKDAKEALRLFPSINIHHNNLAQAIEILHALDCSIDILRNLRIVQEKPVVPVRKKGEGIGVIEAPRGTLYYKLKVGQDGKVISGDIVVPTGQNQIGIEKSIYVFLKDNLGKDKNYLAHEIEKIVRSYDPCMSCASHFLKIKWISE